MAESQSNNAVARLAPDAASRVRMIVQSAASIILWMAACFGGAGRLDWWRGWTSFAIYAAVMGVTGFVVERFNPGLLRVRGKWQRGNTASFDRVFIALFLPLTLGQPLVAGLDAVRFRWLPLAAWTAVPGVLLFVMGMALITWSLAVNPFAESTVRLQTDRGQKVIRQGPYQVIRHPMYAGMLLMYPGTGLMLGSGWALALSALTAVLVAWRTGREDEFLQRSLAGYREYAGHTRYRLAPGLW